MRSRAAATGAVVLSVLPVVVAAWVRTLPGAEDTAITQGHGTDLGAGLVAVAWTTTGALLLWLRPRNPLGWLLVAVGLCQSWQQGLAAYGGYALARGTGWPGASWVTWLSVPLWLPGLLPLLTLLPAMYPDGRLTGRFRAGSAAAAAAGILLVSLGFLLHPEAFDDVAPGRSPLAAAGPAMVLVVVGAVLLLPSTVAIWVGSVVRLLRAASPQRQQLAWLLCVVLPFAVVSAGFLPDAAMTVFGLLIPVAVLVGVLRYRLLGIEVILRRGLVFAVLTAAVVASYLVVTVVAGAQLDRGPLPGVVAAALVAVGLAPLRDRLQAGVDRFVYGDRRDPLRAVTRLGNRVADADEPDLLVTVLATVAEAVRSPAAAVVSQDGAPVATHGAMPGGSVEELPLSLGRRRVGTLQVARRIASEPFSSADRRLLEAMTPQVAAVVRALELARELEVERDRVVAATRQERDRLRGDLHDGLGPSLSGVGLGLQALDDARARGDDRVVDELSNRIQQEIGHAVADVRRIIDDLRPAVLDSARLAEALRRHAADLSASGLTVDVSADELPLLPPDVETAAYRIAREALTNVVRHARAGRVRVRLGTADGALRLQVEDDGRGVGPVSASGVGLGSMRRRAAALGGGVELVSGTTGTTVVATFPLPRAAS